jgi:phosphatidylethanolamine/phosphatidyl-N-methylethanolamine N-methyltransferase
MISRFVDKVVEKLIFAWSFVKSPREIGTPFPCSSAVAEKILQYIPETNPHSKPRYYLEIGPGTGAFTTEFIKKLGPQDHLDLVEIDANFCKVLREKYGKISNVKIHHMSIEHWKPPYRYDAVVTAVPINALGSAEDLSTILSSYERLIKENGILSSIEYVGTSTCRRILLCKDKKKRFKGLLELKERFLRDYGFEKKIVWRNLPPARVTHFKISHK